MVFGFRVALFLQAPVISRRLNISVSDWSAMLRNRPSVLNSISGIGWLLY